MMEAALEGLTKEDGSHPLLIAVTQLTSTSEETMQKELLIDHKLKDVVKHYALNAKKAKLDGIVCSPLEAKEIHEACGNDFVTVTPGIRLVTKQMDDQVRITTPKMAKEAVRKVAKEKNPKNDVWYVKSLFFAYLAIEKYGLFSKAKYSGCEKYNKRTLLQQITQAEIKIKDRQNAAEELRINKEKEEKKNKQQTQDRNANIKTAYSNTSNKVKNSKIVGKSNVVKKTKTTKITSSNKK